MPTGGRSGTRGAVHTTPNPNGAGWVNQRNGHVTSTRRTQANAMAEGRVQAIARHAEHVVHGRGGEIRERNSYGNDPERRKG